MMQAFHMSEAQPYLAPLTGKTGRIEREIARHTTAEASHHDYLQSLGQPRLPKPELPQLKVPALPDDHAEQVANLDERIVKRGIKIDSEKLTAIGKQRFDQLLAIARQSGLWSARGASIDLTSFQSVQRALGAYLAPSVPARKTREQIAESGREKDEVRRIADWRDLWKFSSQEPTFVRDAYEFHDHFASLVLGQSMLEKLSNDGRARSRCFAGGRGRRVDLLLHDWLVALAGEHVIVKLSQPLWALVSWLADEKAKPASPVELARDWFVVRSPSQAQLQIAEAVWHGFLLDYDGWMLWQFVGRRTRSSIEESRLAAWRTQLAKRFVRINQWHASVRSAFVREIDVGTAAPRQQQFEAGQHRAFIDRTIDQLLDCASKLLALGAAEVQSDAVVAHFESVVLAESKRQLADRRATISRQLLAAFPASSFELEFAEVRA